MNSSSYYMWDSCPSLPKKSLLNSIPDSSSAQGRLLSLPSRTAPGTPSICNPGPPRGASEGKQSPSTRNPKRWAAEGDYRSVSKLVTRREDELWWRDFTYLPFQECGWGIFRLILDTQISTGCALMGCQCPLLMISNLINAMMNDFKESLRWESCAKLIV